MVVKKDQDRILKITNGHIFLEIKPILEEFITHVIGALGRMCEFTVISVF